MVSKMKNEIQENPTMGDLLESLPATQQNLY